MPNLPTPCPAKSGLLLVGHGTRDPVGQAGLLQTAALVAQRLPDWRVQPCFLELAEPNIPAGLQMLAAAGVERVTVMPVLLLAAGHARRDIPAAVATAAADVGLTIERQTAPLGSHPALLKLAHQQFLAAVERVPAGEIPAEKRLLLVVARGTTDQDALAKMREIFEIRARQTGLPAELCFLAMAEPSLETVIASIAERDCQQVIVQPHLLFAGALADRLAETIQRAARQFPRQQWILTDTLQADPLLAEAVLGRVFNKDEPTPTSGRIG